jgi:hypothetical protein
MTNSETILKSLESNTTEFKRLCEVKACSPDLLEDLNKALEQGALLSVNINAVMKHLMLLKDRLG